MGPLERWIAALDGVPVLRHADRVEISFPEGVVLIRWDRAPSYVRTERYGLSHAGAPNAGLLTRIAAVERALRAHEAEAGADDSAAHESPGVDRPALRAMSAREVAAALDRELALSRGSFRLRSDGLGPARRRSAKLVFFAPTAVACVFPEVERAAQLVQSQAPLDAVGASVAPIRAFGELPGPFGFVVYERLHERWSATLERRARGPSFARALGLSLARFHSAPVEPDDASSALIRSATALTRTPDLALRTCAVRLVRELSGGASRSAAWVHGDLHVGNIRLVHARAHLVDLDAVHRGAVALDLAMARAELRTERSWRACVGAYERESGRDVDERDIDRVLVLRCLEQLRSAPPQSLRAMGWRRALRSALARLGWPSAR